MFAGRAPGRRTEPAVGRLHAAPDPAGVRLQQGQLRRRQGRRHRPDDRHRRRLRRPEHPGRPEHLRRPVRPARHDGHPGQPDRRDEPTRRPTPTGGWELEESLDVEWAHAMAPGAKILLVEANSANDSDLLAAVDYAAAHANVVSMSWGGGEFSGETVVRRPLQPRGRGVRGLLGRQRRPDLVAGRLAERPGRRRHGADPRRGQHLRRARPAGAAAAAAPAPTSRSRRTRRAS